MVREEIYFHDFQKPRGRPQYIWVNIWGEYATERVALMDTGARIFILPLDIYNQIHSTYRYKLWKTDREIYAGNRTKVDVRGVTIVTLSIANRQFKYRFYVCADARHTILGIDFQEDKHIHLEPGLRVCWINEGGHYTEIPCCSSEEYAKKSKVCMIENYTLEPNTEAILPARLKAGVEQSGKVMMINRTATGFEKTLQPSGSSFG